MNKFPERLKELREQKELTYYSLAKQTGFDSYSISRWENGLQIPNIETLIVLADFFDVPADYLLGRKEY